MKVYTIMQCFLLILIVLFGKRKPVLCFGVLII